VADTTLTWLGQAGFLLEVAGLRILIDPFLSELDGRLYAPPEARRVGTGVDWLLITHEHLDHLDPDSIRALAALSPGASLAVPSALAERAAELAPELDVVAVHAGQRFGIGAHVEVHVMPAWHAVEVDDGYSDGRGIGGLERFVGYVITAADISLYHSGDTLVTGGLRSALARERIDVALLPVNGRDHFREAAGVVGNMDGRDAVQLAEEIGAEILIPMHWDLFAGNTVNPGAAVDQAAVRSSIHMLTLARLLPVRLGPFPRATGGR
jgi:L-ascorbate 6-phosphate lactonase